MVKTIDMQGMRYLNLFEKITKVSTRYFFPYNNMIVFCVPRGFIPQALGKDNSNLKKMSDILRKRIRIVVKPNGIQDIKNFVQAIINPVGFNDLEVKENEVIITAGNQNKAALLGRNKRRFLEMQKIVEDFFKKELRII